MKHSYTLQELSIIIDFRVNDRLTWEVISERLNVSVRDLKKLAPLINQHRPCAYCQRPVPLFQFVNKEFCSHTCYYAYYRGYVRTVEDQNVSYMGRRFVLTKEQVTDALIRRYEHNEDLTVIAADLNVAVSTLSRMLLKVGGKSLQKARKHECPVCSKPFIANSNAKYCSGKCRTIAWRTGIAKGRSNSN